MEHLSLPKLPYELDELEPVISKEIMTLHYTKHHQAYINNYNAAYDNWKKAEQESKVNEMIALQPALRFNGGGHINHSIFWTNLAPIAKGGGKLQNGPLKTLIDETFGSLDKLIEEMSAKAVAVQGSGWAWLGYNKQRKRLEIATCDNQDPLIMKGLVPLLGIDVWEHSYYLQYKNVRADYVKAIWQIINWKNVEERLQSCTGGG